MEMIALGLASTLVMKACYGLVALVAGTVPIVVLTVSVLSRHAPFDEPLKAVTLFLAFVSLTFASLHSGIRFQTRHESRVA